MTSTDSLLLLQKNIPEALHEKLNKHWQSWLQVCDKENISNDPAVRLDVLGKVWACSNFIANNTIRSPKLWFDLIESKLLEKDLSLFDYRCELEQVLTALPVSNDNVLMHALRVFRQKHMIRIAWRDLTSPEISATTTTAQTLKNLTDLAETCVGLTLEYLYQDQCEELGEPQNNDGKAQRLVVLGMGKLGGYELNFSSDIDLIFFFDEEGTVQGKNNLANSQFFTRLGQRFIKILNDITADGMVFRVDMRLRPYGESGPLVMSFSGMEQYYQTQGRDWERYAMIKARVIGGDRDAGKVLVSMLKPFVYRRYLDFGAFESIREMKALINAEIFRKGNENNIKLGKGGIREIEFIGQTFQLLRGGVDHELQTRSILNILSLLSEKNYITKQTADELTDSYNFLRRLENRLQMYADEQTHNLPEDKLIQISIALAMNYDGWQSLLVQINYHRDRVHAHFNDVFSVHESEDDKIVNPFVSLWRDNLDDEDAIKLLQQQKILDCEEIVRQLNSFKKLTVIKSLEGASLKRLDKLMPLLIAELVTLKQAGKVMPRLLNLLQVIARRSLYLALLVEYPMALTQLVTLCNASPWVANLLMRYPVLLDELLDPQALYNIPTKKQQMIELDAVLAYAANDEEHQMEVLRQYKHAYTLRIAAMEIAAVVSVFDVSEQLTAVSEALLEKAYSMAWAHLVKRHGKPGCIIKGEKYQPGMGIVAYGKMGGRELSYSSDLDMVFLHDSKGEQQHTDGEKTIDNSTFFIRLAQRIVHIISAQTANGRLYEVDTRLRPDGAAGMLVSSLDAFDQYQSKKAWVWEHQALIRARMVLGSAHLDEEFDRIRRSVLSQSRDMDNLKKQVIEMRQKMRDSLGSKSKGKSMKFHLKYDTGGIVDIEFIAQYAVLANVAEYHELLEYRATRDLLMALARYDILSELQASKLNNAYQLYRSRSHQRALQEQSSLLDITEFKDVREDVKNIWQQVVEN